MVALVVWLILYFEFEEVREVEEGEVREVGVGEFSLWLRDSFFCFFFFFVSGARMKWLDFAWAGVLS